MSENTKKNQISDAPKMVKNPKYRYYHESCSNTAFLLFEKPKSGDEPTSSNCQHTDGRPMNVGEPIVCDSCRQGVDLLLKNVIPL